MNTNKNFALVCGAGETLNAANDVYWLTSRISMWEMICRLPELADEEREAAQEELSRMRHSMSCLLKFQRVANATGLHLMNEKPDEVTT